MHLNRYTIKETVHLNRYTIKWAIHVNRYRIKGAVAGDLNFGPYRKPSEADRGFFQQSQFKILHHFLNSLLVNMALLFIPAYMYLYSKTYETIFVKIPAGGLFLS